MGGAGMPPTLHQDESHQGPYMQLTFHSRNFAYFELGFRSCGQEFVWQYALKQPYRQTPKHNVKG